MDNVDDKNIPGCDCRGWKRKNSGSVSSAVYGLGFIGALVYYIQHATSFWIGVLGFFKALVWPAFVIYKVLEVLKM
jgi:hypothetical protein